MTAWSELEREIGTLYEGLDRLSYYEFLGVASTSDYIAIREAFYERAQRFHPDRFVAGGAHTLHEAIYAVYKRVAEAYNVLADPQLRVAYDEALRRGESRLADATRARRLTREERQLGNPFARLYMRSAQRKLERGELVGAWIDARLGLSLEDAAPLRGLLDRIEREERERA